MNNGPQLKHEEPSVQAPTKQVGRSLVAQIKDDVKNLKKQLLKESKGATARAIRLQKEVDYQLKLRDKFLSGHKDSTVRAHESKVGRLLWQLYTQPSPGQMRVEEPYMRALEAGIESLRWRLESQLEAHHLGSL